MNTNEKLPSYINATEIGYLKYHLEYMSLKKTMFDKAKNIDTLALGSSHGDYAFNPEHFPSSFNLCCGSQDLKNAFLIYKKIIESDKKLKNIILFYSVFSPGHNLEKSPYRMIPLAINKIFNLGINYSQEDLKYYNNLEIKIEKNKIKKPLLNGYIPLNKNFFPESYTVERRVSEHLKLNKIETENSYLIDIIKLAKNKHKLYIVMPPARSDYKKTAGNSSNLFKSLYEIVDEHSTENNIEIIDFYNSNIFLDSYFGDFDHLIPLGEGSKCFSKELYKKTSKG